MQNRPKTNPTVKLLEVSLPDEFPIDYFSYIQKESDRNKLHFHNLFEIGLCLENAGLFFVGEKVLSFSSGDVSFIYPDQPHIAQSYAQLPSKWVFITVDITRLLGNGLVTVQLERAKESISNIIKSTNQTNLKELVSLIIGELDQKKSGYKSVVRDYINAFCSIILRGSENGNVQGKKKVVSAYILVAPALNYISISYDQVIDMEKLSKLCSVSITHFRRVFKETTGYPPLEYLTRVRLKMAKTILVSTDTPVSEVAFAVGFGSISSFNRQFKHMYGIPPKLIRNNINA